jgi:hypothetical protein
MSAIVPTDLPAGSARPLLDQARQLLARRQLVEAARVYAKVLECEPDCVEALGQLGSLFFNLDNVRKLWPASNGRCVLRPRRRSCTC